MNNPDKLHPCIAKAMESQQQGRISRREFLRLAALLGVSAATAAHLSGCDTPTTAPVLTTSTEIKRGGTLRVGWPVGSATDIDIMVLRQAYEYLTWLDKNNIAYPSLLENWQANEDLTVWILNLRRGIKWSNGDDFIAEDVVQTIRKRITDEGLFSGFLSREGVELVDDFTVRLNLEMSKLDIPEVLYSDAALITHRDEIERNPFDGTNIGTGPFTLETFEEGKGARLVRREGYWQTGSDGESLPYLDAIEYIDLGFEEGPYLAAIQAGDIDALFPLANEYLELRDDVRLKAYSAPTSWTDVLRFRVDLEPWNDNRVRLAVKKMQNRQKILDRSYFGEGVLGHDTHVSPAHPEFAPMAVPPFDPEGAKALLEEAGIKNLAFTISVPDSPIEVAYAETLQEDAREAGINITIDRMPDEDYWTVWNTTPVGITRWQPRTLALTVLRLAYTVDSSGQPAEWNESRWVDEEFSDLLAQAELTRDLEDRRAIMVDIQRIQSERGSIGIAFWTKAHFVVNSAFNNIKDHVTGALLLTEAWYDQDLDLFT